MWYKGVSFTSEQCALVYLVDTAGTRTTTDSFSDMSQVKQENEHAGYTFNDFESINSELFILNSYGASQYFLELFYRSFNSLKL